MLDPDFGARDSARRKCIHAGMNRVVKLKPPEPKIEVEITREHTAWAERLAAFDPVIARALGLPEPKIPER